MRGLVDRRTIAILSRSRAPGVFFQRQHLSAGRGRGRGRPDVEEAPIPEFGAGGSATREEAGPGLGSFAVGRGRPLVEEAPIPEFGARGSATREEAGRGLGLGSFAVGRGRPHGEEAPIPEFGARGSATSEEAGRELRLGSFAVGRGRGRGDVSPPALPPFKPFKLSPAVVAQEQVQVPKVEKKDVVDSRFEDAVEEKDVKPSPSALNVSPDAPPEAGGGYVSKVDGGDLAKPNGSDLSEASDGEPDRLLSFRGLLNIASPGDSSQVDPTKIPFNPFNLPTTPSPNIFGDVAGRGVAGLGRGAPLPRGAGSRRGAPMPSREAPIGAGSTKRDETQVHEQLSREEARARAMALLAKAGEQGSQRRAPPPPAPARPQLSREEAVERAVAVMQEGVERNLSREEERRRRGGAVDNFSDATTMVADRFRRRAGMSSSQQPRGPESAKNKIKRQPRFPRRRDQDEEPQVPLTLREMTPEDEQRLITLEEEEQFKSSLHSKFLVDFEPEYAMEYFGFNPDIDELPQKSLQEILAEAKPFMMIEGMTDAQWDAEVQDVMERAPHLESLVNMYAGPNRLSAREQVSKLQAVADTMPAHVVPEIKDFMAQAMLSLQSNPGIRMKEKERLMNKFVSGFSSF